MKFDVYGRFQLEIRREHGAWSVYRVGQGTRVRASDIVIPNDIAANQLATYLDDLFHELAGPDSRITGGPD